MKSIWKKASVKIWASVSAILLAILLAATFVLTGVPFLYGTVNSIFGGERRVLVKGDPAEYMRYKSEADYTDKASVLSAAQKLNERIVEEGIILLKNDDDALPLSSAQKISVFGKNSISLVLGGSGSSAGSGGAAGGDTLYSSLQAAGFVFNPVMKSFYESSQSGAGRPATPGMGSILTGFPVSETPLSDYTASVKSSYAEYSDAALVVITRIGGEGYDLPRTMFSVGSDSKYVTWSGNRQVIPGARSVDDHYLQLDQNETDMLKEACEHFDKVIVVINCSTSMELGFLDDPEHYAYNSNIKAALWIGNPGKSGINALGKVLSGDINPSGRTVDTYVRDFKRDPTWANFGNNLVGNGNRYTLDGRERNAFFVDYEEGIYVGYRYYETRAFVEGGDWFEENVVFPLGYGLSYTEFEWEVTGTSVPDGAEIAADTVINVDVTVKNTGNTAGKDVVQLYFTAPYYTGQIEKAHVVLGDFAKTKLLEPGEEQELTLTLNARSMASYDYSDANANGYCGYELDAGDYEIKIMRNSHAVFHTIGYTVSEEGIKYTDDSATGNPVENLFDGVSDHISTYLSRADFDGTWPEPPTAEERETTQAIINSMTYNLNDKETDPWYSTQVPQQQDKVLSYNNTEFKLYDLIGEDYNSPLWDDLLNQLTVEQMTLLISKGNFRTVNLDNIAKPLTIDADGPMGFAIFMGDPAIYDTGYYASGCVIGATWSKELAFEMGKMIGNEGLVGNERADGRPYSGWYAPAMNIHRSPFGGRNFEYYSEDALLSGMMASEVVKGAQSKGVYTYCKHFALNEQETNRDTTGLITWANEQSMRELYFVPFEMAVKDGGTTAMMSAFNRIGTVWAGGDYTLLTRLLRDEWGFCGMVITDFNLTKYMDVDQMVRAGGDLNLSPSKGVTSDSGATSVTAIRRAAKNILYTVANSNAMDGMGKNVVYRYALPIWVILFIVADVAVFLICSAWGAAVITKAKRKSKQEA